MRTSLSCPRVSASIEAYPILPATQHMQLLMSAMELSKYKKIKEIKIVNFPNLYSHIPTNIYISKPYFLNFVLGEQSLGGS